MLPEQYEIVGAALLKSPEGKLFEVGQAIISADEKFVDFCSDFVHIFKLGTPLQVVLVKDGYETQRFSGQVYLSSQTMLRLVEVTDEVLPDAKFAYLQDTQIEGEIYATVTEEVRAGFLHLLRKSVTSQQKFGVSVHRLSMRSVCFTSEKRIEKGSIARLKLAHPAVGEISVAVEKALDLGQPVVNYHCQIAQMPPESTQSLGEYLERLCKRRLKLF